MEEKQTAAAGPSFFTIANGLTYSRLILLPIAVIGLAAHHGWIALLAVALTLVTDYFDGRLARRFGQAGQFGKTLDSTVDFVFIYALFIALYASGHMMWNQFIVVYLGMLTILTLQLVTTASGEAGEIATTKLGKAVGAVQFVYLLWLVLALVLPATQNVDAFGTAIFLVLAVLIGLNAIECVNRIRKAV